ncbi:MAG: NAD(P)H-dependent oxidoreductase [Methanomassiliicoccales archaeon]
MRILAITGSPRKNGTGAQVLKEIEARMSTHGEVEMDILNLRDANLSQCKGCFQCISKGEDRCPMREEMEEIEERIEAADGIILISPGYVQNVSALMKNFIERMAYTNHRPRFFGKKVMLVANGGSGLDRTLEGLRVAIGGPEIASELAYLQLPWTMQESAVKKRQARLEKAADEFYDAVSSKSMTPSFNNYLRFLFFKGASAEAGEWLPADHEFYRDLDGYYYDVPIGLGMRIRSMMLMPIVRFFTKGMGPRSDGAHAD